ncbi:MAG: radical SAM protein [Spirochaetes bacterium]|nr:radical SAM protein [Spirochaetota bacterium]
MSDKINILFVNSPLSSEEKLGDLADASSSAPPLGLCYLASAVRQNGYTPGILDPEALKYSIDETVREIIKISPKYVGITSTTIAIGNANKLSLLLKEHLPDIKIIIGGAHLTAVCVSTMERYESFDIGVIAEGEKTIVELLEVLDKEKNLDKVDGIIYRKNGKIIRTKPRAFIKNLDEIPFPAWDLLPGISTVYRPGIASFQRLPSTTLITSRGCPGQCVFCDRSVFGNAFRFHSADYVLEMIRILIRDYGIKDIFFQDDTFTLFRQRLVEICEKMISEKMDLTWTCNSRVEKIDPEIFKLMKRAGCYSVAFGIESGSPVILENLKKKMTLSRINEVIDAADRAGLITRGFFLVGNPGETEETIKDTINFTKKSNLSYVQVLSLTPYPGCELHDNYKKWGELDDSWDKMNGRNIIFVPNGLTEEKLNYYLRKFYYDFYLRPKVILKHIKYLFQPGFMVKIINGLKMLFKLLIKK